MTQQFHSEVNDSREMKTYIHKNTYTRMFIKILLILVLKGKQMLINWRENQQMFVCITIKYYSVIIRNELLLYATV